jgi:hypothetical protein
MAMMAGFDTEIRELSAMISHPPPVNNDEKE